MRRLFLSACAVALGLSIFSTNSDAYAQDPATETAIKYRQSVMKAVGGNMGAMVGIMKGAGDKANLAAHAGAMADLSKIAPTLFPAGSDFGETTALPVIWEKPADFSAAIKKFQDAADNLASVAQSGDMAAFGPAFKGLGESCKNCHENFREKKEKK
ncbi:MAG: cytochrome c [Rhodospirillaceae bacterium]|nr:cytochrome c [Rhodospirillaceae bacterium]